MIPNALASTGPYADWWGHLKSIDHALDRIIEGEMPSELDTDRLHALLFLLEDVLYFCEKSDPIETFTCNSLKSPDYSPAVNVKSFIEKNEQFKIWEKSRKKSFPDDLRRLNEVLRGYLENNDSSLLRKSPITEFTVLRAIVDDMLAEAEVALYA